MPRVSPYIRLTVMLLNLVQNNNDETKLIKQMKIIKQIFHILTNMITEYT